jgi:hypothetical protein
VVACGIDRVFLLTNTNTTSHAAMPHAIQQICQKFYTSLGTPSLHILHHMRQMTDDVCMYVCTCLTAIVSRFSQSK